MFATEHDKIEPALYDFLPPTCICLESRCNLASEGRGLMEPIQHQATLFTKDHGPVPVYTTSYNCHNCNIWYYHNYYVHGGATM
ncbi:hypothetical protein JB92DRAFT_2747801 [Gautieria morchelliformis]|nr:hypothetical protein JB92DRAFT_2747801 [Gautieria morchelliformis]